MATTRYVRRGEEGGKPLAVRRDGDTYLVTDSAGVEHRVLLELTARAGVLAVEIDGTKLIAGHVAKGGGRHLVTLHGVTHELELADQRLEQSRAFARAGAAHAGHKNVAAPIPGLITEVKVELGQQVTLDQTLVVLYAMKLENEIRAPSAGTVVKVHVSPQQSVEKGAPLVELEG